NNTSAFDAYQFAPSYLTDVSSIAMKTDILGVTLAAPVILSPTGMNRLFHHEKEPAVARAAAAHGLAYSLSTLSTTSIEEVAEATSGPKIFQIYVHKDRGLTEEFVDRCKAARYTALCLTVDTPVAGNRERDLHTGFTMPPRLTLSSFASFAMHPGWTLNLLRHPDFRLANLAERDDALSAAGTMGLIDYVNAQFDRSVTWEDAASVIERWGGPFIIKGLQTASDARRARDIGASAIMISNHGGRQLEGAPAPVDCVRPIRDAIGSDMEIIVDGGVRRGVHALKALALGADAVSFGRPYLYALAAGGRQGVERFLGSFLAEIERDLALLGRADVRALDRSDLYDLAAAPQAQARARPSVIAHPPRRLAASRARPSSD
ncbi:MAG: alpha-hydroxy-acid oxidizing protein, partial [Caulobacterales bacterium]|nr:alpha-hydroxy-acid oxidizing protein [Caulobacterales bacterium]